MKMSFKFMYLSIVGINTIASVYASDAIGPGDSDSRWIVGAGVAAYHNVYRGEGNDVGSFLNIEYNGEYFFFKDGSLNLSVRQSGPFSIGLTVRADGNFLSDEDNYGDNINLRGLNERDYTAEGGFYVNYTTDLGRLNFTVVTDIGGEHNGQELSLAYTFDFNYADWNINPVMGVAWMSDDKVDYYYGVSSAEANQRRVAYEADDALTVFAGIRGRYEFTDNWDINLDAGVTHLDSEISNSSIVDENYTYYTSATISYNF